MTQYGQSVQDVVQEDFAALEVLALAGDEEAQAKLSKMAMDYAKAMAHATAMAELMSQEFDVRIKASMPMDGIHTSCRTDFARMLGKTFKATVDWDFSRTMGKMYVKIKGNRVFPDYSISYEHITKTAMPRKMKRVFDIVPK